MISAMGIQWDDMALIESVCADPDTLYSWTRARVLTVDGEAAGALISYPGADYERLRVRTWEWIWGRDAAAPEGYEPETYAGEYYLDSLAVRPEHRGCGYARRLLLDGVSKGHALGFGDHITLIADTENPALISYYESAGFCPLSRMLFFGHDYTRMCIRPSSQDRR